MLTFFIPATAPSAGGVRLFPNTFAAVVFCCRFRGPSFSFKHLIKQFSVASFFRSVVYLFVIYEVLLFCRMRQFCCRCNFDFSQNAFSLSQEFSAAITPNNFLLITDQLPGQAGINLGKGFANALFQNAIRPLLNFLRPGDISISLFFT